MPNTQENRNSEKAKSGITDCIEETANQLLYLLESNGKMTLAELARSITHLSANEIAMALGWLAREGRVEFVEIEERWRVGARKAGK